MSMVGLTAAMLSAHAEHKVRRERCPICAKWGPAPAPEGAFAGRPIAVNAPQSMNIADW